MFRERTPAPVLFDTPQGHAERFHFIQCVELSILLIAARTPLRAEERGRGCTTLARPLCKLVYNSAYLHTLLNWWLLRRFDYTL